MVWDWCMDLMADWAICLAVKVTNAQPEKKRRQHNNEMDCGIAGKKWVLKRAGVYLTTTESIWASEYPALLYLSIRWEHKSDVVLITFLRDHSNKQLPVFHCCIKHNATSNTAALSRVTEKHNIKHVNTCLLCQRKDDYLPTRQLGVSSPYITIIRSSPQSLVTTFDNKKLSNK